MGCLKVPCPSLVVLEPRLDNPSQGKISKHCSRTGALRGLLDWIVYDPAFLDELSYYRGAHLGPHKAQDVLQLSEIIASSVVKLTGS